MAGVFFFYRGPELFGSSIRIAHTTAAQPPSVIPGCGDFEHPGPPRWGVPISESPTPSSLALRRHPNAARSPSFSIPKLLCALTQRTAALDCQHLAAHVDADIARIGTGRPCHAYGISHDPPTRRLRADRARPLTPAACPCSWQLGTREPDQNSTGQAAVRCQETAAILVGHCQPSASLGGSAAVPTSQPRLR